MLLALWIAVPTAKRLERERAESEDSDGVEDGNADPVEPQRV
jgi:hypothetical protein